MNANNFKEVKIKRAERWQVYYRLQELEIPCNCPSNQPLEVKADNATAAIQLWSVVKQITDSRFELVNWLERCWELNREEK
ncbi:MAG: hypothetical protein DSM107014_10775 [Gomphosphaeria aponina SAG 52.96 = DSM 107014]|uniref:Uncharacterized protein n=1 Tax=Gomphosphaeria aponina SAG 52.96 = DSM 107014 TaxID=1521640 RepID=A0A941GU88_9CHRO|nr:hypothetical protein [Gomphosphaeria aponina SAG 52.96 = DSM 107014]